jgi:cation transport regulator
MPYDKVSELPDSVKDNLPKHAQEIYKEAYNSAWDQYDDPEERRGDASREETAHRVAWSAVKKKYEKGDDGQWREKGDWGSGTGDWGQNL